MTSLDAATVLLQWAVGGLAFGWVTTRHRMVGPGYGWLIRGTFALVAAGAVAAGRVGDPVPVRDAAAVAVVVAAVVALAVSVTRRRAGVSGQRTERERRAARVAAMTGARQTVAGSAAPVAGSSAPVAATPGTVAGSATVAATSSTVAGSDMVAGSSSTVAGSDMVAGSSAPVAGSAGTVADSAGAPLAGVSAPSVPVAVRSDRAGGPEFPPVLDLVAPVVGVVGLVAAGLTAASDEWLSVARTLTGAAFLGAVTDAMLLGHWYLVQPGLPRRLLLELVAWVGRLWPVEVGLLLVPPGMVSVLTGAVDDGWGGTLGWMWVACALTTIGLVFVTRAALRERSYSAVMAATGLLYLAILTAFGTDLVARAVLA